MTAAFSTGLVVSALVGIPVGRCLDRTGPLQVMTTGSVLADTVAHSRAFLLLVAAVFTGFAVVVNQVPLLIERGLSTTGAAWPHGRGGLGQVLGRLGYRHLVAATTVRGRGDVVLALTAAATGLLGVLPGPAVLLIAPAMLAGAARGVFTLLQAMAISDRWGAAHYGRFNGLLSAPALLAIALAPWAGSVLGQTLGGYPAVFGGLAGLAAVAAVLALGTTHAPQRHHARRGPSRLRMREGARLLKGDEVSERGSAGMDLIVGGPAGWTQCSPRLIGAQDVRLQGCSH